MVLGSEMRVRQLGGAHDDTELPIEDITEYLKVGTRRVEDLTGREEADWIGPPAHPDIDVAHMAASYFAAIMVVDRFSSIDDTDTKSRSYERTGQALCESINRGKSETGTSNPSIAYVKGSYQSSRLNPGVTPYKSTY
jgi:hypothetical protein